MFHLYDINTERILWSGGGPYLVDGQPGSLPPHLIEIVDVEDLKPEVPADKVAVPSTVVDVQARQNRTTWSLADAPLEVKTKLELDDRMGEAQADALEAFMDTALQSPNADMRRMARRWHKAINIDPNDPETRAGLDALVAAGLITTPVSVLFAP